MWYSLPGLLIWFIWSYEKLCQIPMKLFITDFNYDLSNHMASFKLDSILMPEHHERCHICIRPLHWLDYFKKISMKINGLNN